ncbi:MAG TPA: polysaccharide deacetylase family protein [Thermodesulfobacteriota bacterium]|nr:polysaccharide deacetylase family protein [Thermodesulfobacteriota bacterium]
MRRVAQWLRNKFTPKAIILLYHRVVELPSVFHSMCVRPQHFAEHLEVLQKSGRPMRLQQFVQALRKGHLPDRAVVVTFDDGYADNLYNAKPLLERYGIPATFFITTGYVGRGREFWWDELDRLLLQPRNLPETLSLSINGNLYQWHFGSEGNHNMDDKQFRNCPKVEKKDEPTPRQRTFRSIYRLLYSLPDGERQRALNKLLNWTGMEPKARPTHLTLSADELTKLAEGKLIEIGAHTVTHSSLPLLPNVEQRDEIYRSKAYLEESLSQSVTSFSYPHGSLTEETAGLVREAGFICACSSSKGVILKGSNFFQLPRVVVGDWNGEEFAKHLRKWFSA